MPKITSISHIVLYVKDLDKMVDFYTNMLGLVKYRENANRMVFLTPDPELDDHQLALVKGREGDAKLIAHIAWKVETPAEIKEFYERFKAHGVPIDHCVSHAYDGDGQHRLLLFPRPRRQPPRSLRPGCRARRRAGKPPAGFRQEFK